MNVTRVCFSGKLVSVNHEEWAVGKPRGGTVSGRVGVQDRHAIPGVSWQLDPPRRSSCGRWPSQKVRAEATQRSEGEGGGRPAGSHGTGA